MLFQSGESDTIRILNMEPEEVVALLKCQCKVKCISRDITGRVDDFIYLLDRTDRQTIICSKAKGRAIKANSFESTFDECRDLVAEIYSKADSFEVVVSGKLFKEKQQIFDIFPNIRKEIISGLVSLDYKDGMWIIKLRNQNFVETVYYWPETNYLYMVNKNNMFFQEPSTVVNCIEDLLC